MRTLIAAVGIATALTVGAGQAGAAPLPLVDAPAAAPVAGSGSSTGSAFPITTGSVGVDAALNIAGTIVCAIMIPDCFHRETNDVS
ncbi:hypothetical protein ACFRAQ_23940 [Nocardia sp. NPDC056611]|uniref:hypothetical protein n=1 Tax=unclassified Nocardia TaxID=2637762 RepID=UPI003672B388